MKQEDTVDFQIKSTWQCITKMYNEEAAKYEGTMATGYVLLNIDFDKGTPSTSLGPKMGMEATSLSRMLKNMEGQGLIVRKKNPNDGRSVLVHLTDFGKEKRQDAREAVLRFNEVVSKACTQDQMKSFFEVFEIINDLIKKRKIYSEQNEENN